MTTLAAYLVHKRDAFHTLRQRVLSPGYEPAALRACVTAEGCSSVWSAPLAVGGSDGMG